MDLLHFSDPGAREDLLDPRDRDLWGAVKPRHTNAPPPGEINPDTFRWRTMDNRILKLSEMQTDHLFNAMKMVFNHMAEAHGGSPIWFQKRYEAYQRVCKNHPFTYGALVVFFLKEIDRRGDLPEKYREPYAQIRQQILPLQLAATAARK